MTKLRRLLVLERPLGAGQHAGSGEVQILSSIAGDRRQYVMLCLLESVAIDSQIVEVAGDASYGVLLLIPPALKRSSNTFDDRRMFRTSIA
jgi:hypothetical protein